MSGFVGIGEELKFPEHCHRPMFNVLSAQRWSYKSALPRKKPRRNGANASLVDPQAVSRIVRASFERDLSAVLPAADMLPSRPRIVDIGAGMGMYHVYVSRRYGRRSEHVLVDRDVDEVVSRGFLRTFGYRDATGPSRFSFYTNLSCARDILAANGVPAANIRLVDASAMNVRSIGRQSADVVMSLWSWGFHYPLETYLDAAAEILKPSGRLILLVDEVRRRIKNQLVALNATGLGCTRDKVDYKLGSVRNRGVRLVCRFERSVASSLF